MANVNLDPTVLINFLYVVYNLLKDGCTHLFKIILGETFSAYGDILTLLTVLTAIYILLELSNAFRKILGIIIALAWAIFITSFLLEKFL
ncbi:hypothetical protein KEJ27_01465 [Candidatus Bathyarchaeota archaeon]|nr:hypothetical protein [Candidatus Bathyarchaeota archaeon]MBS7613002.1 hypothetical protein [Candidatus Bathyarchaeota archaeon]MBS7617584.1 hypothetical protein [Candidatus Bathyarchaeota archaeon]